MINNETRSGSSAEICWQIFPADKNGTQPAINVRYAETCMDCYGVKIFTVLTIPEKGKTFPVVLFRTPYQKDVNGADHVHWAYDLVKAGYAVVLQCSGGTFRSTGEWIPRTNDRKEGLCALEWIRKQSFYQGEIYLTGASYGTTVHFSYMDTNPSDVKGAALFIQEDDYYNAEYRNGFFKAGLHGGWFVENYKGKTDYDRNAFRMLPLKNFSKAVFGKDFVPGFSDSLEHPWPEDPFWVKRNADYAHAMDKPKFPVLLISAFHDIYTEGMFAMWNKIAPEAKKQCAMVITPYSHGYDSPTCFEYPHGKISEQWPNYTVDWFNSIREKRKPNFVTLGNVTWYSLFEDKWITAPALENGKNTVTLYLNDHSLDDKPANGGSITCTYNPFAPAEFPGGLCNNFGGQQIQPKPNFRYDVVSFLSKPFEKDTSFRGSSDVDLMVSSDCPDTCFYARFSLVRDGVAYGMRDDIVSLRRQNPDYVPNTKARVRLHFAEDSFLVRKGDVIRLDVSFSCWPHFVPHTNRVGLFSEQTGADIAHNTIHYGESRFTLYSTK